MNLSGKSLGEYASMVLQPAIAGMVLSLISIKFEEAGMGSSPLLLPITFMVLLLPIFVGWNSVKKFKCDWKQAAASGIVYSAIVSIPGFLLSILDALGNSAAAPLWPIGISLDFILEVVLGTTLSLVGVAAASLSSKQKSQPG